MAKKKPTNKGAAGVVTNLGFGGRTAMPSRVPDGAPGPLPAPAAGRVRIRTRSRKHELVVRLDEDPAMLVPQVPRVEQIDIPWRASQSQWMGQMPAQLTLSVVFDAYPWGSIETEWETLEAMGRPVQAGRSSGAPSPLQISGTVPGQDRWWVLTGVEPGDAIWSRQGFRQRQHVVLTLGQWLPVGRAERERRTNPRTSKGAVKKRKAVTVKRGETLVSIALRELGSSSRWRDIARLNKHKNGKQRRSPEDLKVGEKLKMPQD